MESTTFPVGRVPKPKELELSHYANSDGYDSSFLEDRVDRPKMPHNLLEDCVTLKDTSSIEPRYHHFSIIMSKSRRLAYLGAVNIDGNKLQPIKFEPTEQYFDPRVDRKYQVGPEAYIDSNLVFYHLIGRRDPVWGNVAREAEMDTLHITNCIPHYGDLNDPIWQSLTDYVLDNADLGSKNQYFYRTTF